MDDYKTTTNAKNIVKSSSWADDDTGRHRAPYLFAGFHFRATGARLEYTLNKDLVVVLSGIVEITLGAAMVFLSGKKGFMVGLVLATFYIAIFPGNISQYITHTNALLALIPIPNVLSGCFFSPC